MISKINISEKKLENLMKFLTQNKEVDFKTFNLQDKEKILELKWKHLKKKLDEILPLVKAYQRLIRIIPDQDNDIAMALLKENVYSAVQIASMPKKQFMSKWLKIFGGKEQLAETIYKNAVEKRSTILVQYMDILQNNEPHIKAARFNL